MKIIKLLVYLLLAISLHACEFMSYDEYSLPKYDGAYQWEEVIKDADWQNRVDHAAVSFDGKLWVLGGYNPGERKRDTYYEDVWTSADGKHWEQVVSDAPWKGRRGHSVITYDDGTGEAMYLIGGFSVNESNGYRQYCNDVWKSRDGRSWYEIKEHVNPLSNLTEERNWIPRMNHSCVVAEHYGVSYIYLIGGYTMLEGLNGRYAMKYFNDVWRSTDGIDWDSLPNADYGIRAEHGATVNPESGRIYIQGGTHGVIFEPALGTAHPILNWEAVWYSDDGIDWKPEVNLSFENGYLWRADHQLVFYKDAVWCFPGKSQNTVHYLFANDNHYPIWKMETNGNISLDSEGAAFDARHGYASVLHNNKVWVLGGITSQQGQANDVWSGEIK